jgi:hypothetical protein
VIPFRCRHGDAGIPGDIAELAAAEVLPQFVAAEFVHEIDVVQTVAIDIGHGDAAAVIVVNLLVSFSGLVDDVINESDAALFQFVGEAEVVEHLELAHGLQLSLAARSQ